jgi:hypothetical protein
MAPRQTFHLGSPIAAIPDVDDMWRSAAGVREGDKIGIGSHDGEPIGLGVLPDRLVPGEPGETGIEYVD